MLENYAHAYAIACIKGSREYPHLRGSVKFYRRYNGTLVVAVICRLPETQSGFFAFHIHEGDTCNDNFANTGSHLNPYLALHPMHSGDLPPLLSCNGSAYLQVLSNRFCIEDIVGKTVLIHCDADDFHTQPSGNAGAKIACGVIRKI